MDTFNLTDYSRIHFNASDEADRLDGHSEKEPNFYDDFYEKGGNPLRDVRINQYSQLLDEAELFKTGSNHLDVGCGDGLFVELCRKIAKTESFGIDAHAPSGRPFVIKQSLAEFIQQAEVKDSRKFDVISFMDVLEHFEEPETALRAIKTLLKSDGSLLLKVPSKNSLIYRLAKLCTLLAPALARGTFIRMYQVHFPPPHYYYYNLSSISKLLEKNNFQVRTHGFISETPIPVLHKRLWNIKPAIKPFAYIALFLLQILTPKSMYDGLYLVASPKN